MQRVHQKHSSRRLRSALIALGVSVPIACASVDPFVPALVQLGGTLIDVATQNFGDGRYAATAKLLIETLKPTAVAMIESGRKERELAATKQAVDKEYAALANPYDLAAHDPSEKSWGAAEPAAAALVSGRGIEPPAEAGPVSLDIALLRRVGGTLKPIQNGDVLKDAEGRPGAVGDQVRGYFSPAENLYVYVVAVDANARVQPLFPPQLPPSAPVAAGAQVFLPGTEGWYGLDADRGLQHVYFYASRTRNADLEAVLYRFASAPPPSLSGKRYSVSAPTVIEDADGSVRGRGLTGVSSQPQSVTLEKGSVEIEATRVTGGEGRLVATRYFDHQ